MSTKRNANGEGSIRQRQDGRWEARYTRQVAGVWKRYSIFAKTKAEAAQQLRAELAKRDAGSQPLPARETVENFLAAWLKGAEPSVRPRTRDSYRQIVTKHLVPHLGRTRLARLGPEQIQSFYADLADQGLSAKTVMNVHGVLHRALDQAARWRLIPTNPADLIDPPKVERRQMRALDAEESRLVLMAAAGDPLEALYRLAISTGMRQGELLALRWPDVDLDRGTVSVVATLEQRSGREPIVARPKTTSSVREVELAASTVDALRRHRLAHPSIGFVFARPDGRPLSMSIIGKAWARLNRRAGVPRIPFHGLRHTAASLMLKKRIPAKVVQEMLGHADISITLRTYSHVLPGMQREAAQAMDELLG